LKSFCYRQNSLTLLSPVEGAPLRWPRRARVDPIDERTQRAAHAIGDHDLAVGVEAVGGQAFRSQARPDETELASLSIYPQDLARAIVAGALIGGRSHSAVSHQAEDLRRDTF